MTRLALTVGLFALAGCDLLQRTAPECAFVDPMAPPRVTVRDEAGQPLADVEVRVTDVRTGVQIACPTASPGCRVVTGGGRAPDGRVTGLYSLDALLEVGRGGGGPAWLLVASKEGKTAQGSYEYSRGECFDGARGPQSLVLR